MDDGQIVSLYLRRDEEAIAQTERKYGRALLAPARKAAASASTIPI